MTFTLTSAETLTRACPICTTETSARREATPYWQCSGCGVWFQDPMPPKIYHGPEEPPMTQADIDANLALGAWLFESVMKLVPGPTLDIGCKVPLLAADLADRGCRALAIDAEPGRALREAEFSQIDFEDIHAINLVGEGFALITLVHTFEHLLSPIRAFARLRSLVADDGAVFIRMPDHTVPGYERDLTAHHYTIHPYFHCLSSIAELCARTTMFVIESQSELRPGQRDLVLRPI